LAHSPIAKSGSGLHIASGIGLGLIAGYVSVAFGLTGIALAIVLSILAIAWFRRRFALEGIYFGSFGLSGVAILVPTIVGRQPCPGTWNGAVTVVGNCYAPSTVPALVAYVVIVLIGVGLVAFALTRGRRGLTSHG
jgi:hypothetical protein